MQTNRMMIKKRIMKQVSNIIAPMIEKGEALHFGGNEYNLASIPAKVAELIGKPEATGKGFNAYYSATVEPKVYAIVFI